MASGGEIDRLPALVQPSMFNFTVRDGDGCVALFNTASGALTRLEGGQAAALGELMESPQSRVADHLPDETRKEFIRGGFLVRSDADEVGAIRERFWTARGGTPAVLTITTTMDCNLGCYYCYEERSQSALEASAIDDILALVDQTVIARGRKSLHVDWYGGEPLLNVEFLGDASHLLQEHCRTHGVAYHASVISNGTLWPDDPVAFVRAHAIRQVQISFDGMRAHHDKRRRIRKGFRYSGNRIVLSSFDEAVALVDALVGTVRVDLRFNIDRRNIGDLTPFLDFAEERCWFSGLRPAVFQPARLSAYSSVSSFMRGFELTLAEFDAERTKVRARLDGIGQIEESEAPDGYPHPRTSVCAALSDASTVIGADKALYRCGLQVGEAGRAVGQLGPLEETSNPMPDESFWAGFDPTRLPTCGHCSFLPVCWGGCPKKHLERDMHAIGEQGRFWRTNLPRLIAKAAGFGDSALPTAFGDRHQFRDIADVETKNMAD